MSGTCTHKFTSKSVKCEHSQMRERAGFNKFLRCNAHTPNINFFFSRFKVLLDVFRCKMVLFVSKHAHSNVLPAQWMRKDENGILYKAIYWALKVLKEFVSLWFIYQIEQKKVTFYTRNYVLETREFALFSSFIQFLHWKVYVERDRESISMANACGKRARINQNTKSHSTIINVNQHEFTCAPFLWSVLLRSFFFVFRTRRCFTYAKKWDACDSKCLAARFLHEFQVNWNWIFKRTHTNTSKYGTTPSNEVEMRSRKLNNLFTEFQVTETN